MYYHTNSKNAVLAHSHYSDPAYDNEAVIFGKKEDGLQWEYADSLYQWDYTKHKKAWELAVETCGTSNTARRIECYLQNYFDDESIQIICILSGTERYSGYPWYAYGFTKK